MAEYALISAFRDSRFRKIEEWELENLECSWVPPLFPPPFIVLPYRQRVLI